MTIITNTGSLQLFDVMFYDTIPPGTTFVNNSVTIDNISYPNYNPQTGFNLGTIIPNQIVIVIFQVQVN